MSAGMIFRVLAGICGLVAAYQGLNWVFGPVGTAQALRMPLLDGVARSNQISAHSAFFLCIGGFALFGALREQVTWLRAGAMLPLVSAAVRIVAWAMHDAPLAPFFVGVELVMSVILLLSARFIASTESDGRQNA